MVSFKPQAHNLTVAMAGLCSFSLTENYCSKTWSLIPTQTVHIERLDAEIIDLPPGLPLHINTEVLHK